MQTVLWKPLSLACALVLLASACSSNQQETDEGAVASAPAQASDVAEAAATAVAGPPAAASTPDGFLQGALADIAQGCRQSPELVAVQDAYGPAVDWVEGDNGRWEVSLKSPDGGRALSPVLGVASVEIHEAEGYWDLRVPVAGGEFHGLQVSGLVWSSGLENGIKFFQVQFPHPLAEVQARLSAEGVELTDGEYATPALAQLPDGLSTVLVCDESM